MRRSKSLFTRLCIAALVSGLAALLMVTVGPGFAEKPDELGPNEQAAEQAQEATADEGASEDASNDASEDASNSESTGNDAEAESNVTAAGGPHDDPIDEGASTEPDSHGHVGAGTGTDEGSQADPGHMEDRNGTDGKTNGPGTGDSPGDTEDCGDNTDGSDADFSGNGANKHGPYDSTCDGRISQNGQGDDAPGGGTPCAGCVGKADNKQPPGQVAEFNGQKPNDMGYECDGNQGVGAHYGNGNPAHTGDCGSAPIEDCTGDDNPNNNDGCEPIDVCRMSQNGQWKIVTIRKDERLSTDLDAPASGKAQDCAEEEEDLIDVCRMNNGGNWNIVTIPRDERLSTDRDAPSSGQAKDCAEEDEPIEVCRMDSSGHWRIEEILPGDRLSTDRDAPASGKAKDCAPDEKVWICHATGSANNPYQIISVSKDAWEDDQGNDHKNHHADFEVSEGTTEAECAPELITICYELNSGDWAVAEDIDERLKGTYRNAREVPKGTDAEDCEDVEITICYEDDGVWKVKDIDSDEFDDYRNAKVVPKGTDADECEDVEEYCPPGTDMAGLPMPNGGRDECDDDDVLPEVIDKKVCPKGSELGGELMPDDKNCNPTVVVTVCPVTSDHPMEVLPDGRTAAWCYEDEVQGETIRNIPAPGQPKPNVQRKLIGRPDAGILPFTGASVLAFLVLALQLIAAGSLILRGRRA